MRTVFLVMTLVLTLGLGLVIVSACQVAPFEVTDAERSQVEAAVTEALEIWMEGLNAQDATLATSMADPEANFVDFGMHYQNQAELREGLARLVARFQSWDSAWDDVQVDVIRPDLALFFGQFTMSRRSLDGRLQEADPYIFVTGRFELRQSEWKLTHAQLSGALRFVEELAQSVEELAQSAEDAAVSNRVEGYFAALNEGDVETYAAYYTENAVRALGTDIVVGRANIEKASSEAFADGGLQINFTRHATRLLSPTTAIVHGAFEITSNTPPTKGHQIFALVKEGNDWLIAALQVANALPEQ